MLKNRFNVDKPVDFSFCVQLFSSLMKLTLLPYGIKMWNCGTAKRGQVNLI